MKLNIRNLSKTYGTQKALNQIDLTISENEIIGLLGPNGAGKSTLMKSIVGVLDLEDGQITMNDQTCKHNELYFKKNIGYLPENNPLYQEMYVIEYLEFVGSLHQNIALATHELIDLVGLSPEKNKKIHQLSKGYKQRVGIAQALIHNPKLLILDEPTNGLDPNQIIEIRNLIQSIAQQKTIILSTHIMQEVEALCQRVILIHLGQIVLDCPIHDFKGKFGSLEMAFQHYTNA